MNIENPSSAGSDSCEGSGLITDWIRSFPANDPQRSKETLRRRWMHLGGPFKSLSETLLDAEVIGTVNHPYCRGTVELQLPRSQRTLYLPAAPDRNDLSHFLESHGFPPESPFHCLLESFGGLAESIKESGQFYYEACELIVFGEYTRFPYVENIDNREYWSRSILGYKALDASLLLFHPEDMVAWCDFSESKVIPLGTTEQFVSAYSTFIANSDDPLTPYEIDRV